MTYASTGKLEAKISLCTTCAALIKCLASLMITGCHGDEGLSSVLFKGQKCLNVPSDHEVQKAVCFSV
jgi:hypothetical protein